jgi:hypothetical protein
MPTRNRNEIIRGRIRFRPESIAVKIRNEKPNKR